MSYAAKALNDLYGNQVNGLVKGGIRLSYSKNPLGVRTPTNVANGNGFQQQQGSVQSFSSSSSFSNIQDAFSTRQPTSGVLHVDVNAVRNFRRDHNELTSPSYHFAASPPPPRFFSPPPSSGFGFNAQTSLQGFSSSFSPFGSSTPPNMTPQLETHDPIASGGPLSSNTPSVDVARAG